MTITEAGLNRATLARQSLLEREESPVPEAVRRAVALQAQHPASPYVALWNRVSGFDASELDTAFADGVVVKATLMRITLHAVHARDYPAFRSAVQPTLRAARLDGRFRATGMTPEEIDALVPELVRFAGTPRTTAEIDAWLRTRPGVPGDPAVWRALRAITTLVHRPSGGPWAFEHRPVYRAAEMPPALDREAADAALPALVHRYLTAFGPATVADVAQFSLVPRARIRDALAALTTPDAQDAPHAPHAPADASHAPAPPGGGVERLPGPAGETLYDVPGAPRPPGDMPAPPRLLGMWDSVLLAYADRSRVIPAEYRTLVTRVNGDVLPTLLVDGRVAGVWRATAAGVEATAFRPLPAGVWRALSAEAEGLVALLAGRDPEVYRRHHHWWAKFGDAAAEVRLLAGPGG
ncbi:MULTISPECIES: winged helix DNA-binding domain-containing protein [unclassified Streptomyces]|uniref:winged helix DNA-binding domain-containing protein n=1 Tax=unclassified Streptomyces TaxID=2593676 RepID=UPI000CD5400D|nr:MULTISPECIES: winged helix DNA-binding domain-containing protein [unclassified Streptomyces]